MFPQILLITPLVCLAIYTITYTITTLQYRLFLLHQRGSNTENRPVPIPYKIPWLGHTVGFLTQLPGRFFLSLLDWHTRESGASKLVLGGQTTYVVFSHHVVQALYKLKRSVASRENFHEIFLTKATGMSHDDHDKLISETKTDRQEVHLHQEFMLKQSGVNELTRAFIRFFQEEIEKLPSELPLETRDGVGLYAWLHPMMFRASVTAFMGKYILDVYPNLEKDFPPFDRGILDLIFGVSKFFKPQSYAAQAKILSGFEKWIHTVDNETKGRTPDPQNPEQEWEPFWGSRFSRARQALWIEREMSQSGRASIELGLIFGLNSNAIPATGWMLMHILDPEHPDILPRVMEEIRKAVVVDDDVSKASVVNLNINQLISAPLLQSIFHEVLRVYVDVLITRKLHQDVELPLDVKDGGRTLKFEKESIVLAPSIASHYDSVYFAEPPADIFYAERFLEHADPTKQDGQYVFSSGGSSSRMWPWGGGKSMCPGRVFAKQEILAAVAMVLLTFDIEASDEDSFNIPPFSRAYPGSGTIVPGGDVKVRIKRRTID
ncbi:cytochrome P450 [Truncatella angustata]|uniref:Cytochrome P450 n=1 Tax=Truncatella angustata TaxID=152316 RepID=A0A9P8UVI1_9PEZI|nr:cytochrome P450 [Truncatella angustata]KAH6658987.1 cytochrome P450 [Truncatella angustata]KAH8203208.1 hypothetical protein TruAng_002613 [Truncatella angustata]